MPLPDCHTSSYTPPKGVAQLDIHYDPSEPLDAERLKKDDEIWLFRIPGDFPVTEMHSKGLGFPTEYLKVKMGSDALASSAKKSGEAASKKELFTIKESPESVGELRDMRVILPSSSRNAHQMVTRTTSRFFSIEPKNLSFDMEALIKNSESARNSPYVERKHPAGLKLQSAPYGSETDGDALVKTFSRYSDTLSSDGPLTMKDEDKTPVPPKKKAKHIKEEPILVEDPADVKLKSYKRSTKKKSKS